MNVLLSPGNSLFSNLSTVETVFIQSLSPHQHAATAASTGDTVSNEIHINYKLRSKFHQTLLNSDQSIPYKILLWNDYLLNDAILLAGVMYWYSKGKQFLFLTIHQPVSLF
jgi:hypothetical protein